MITLPETLVGSLHARERHWLVTGNAGFVGSHLVETLLRAGQRVTGLDNLSTGHIGRLAEVQAQLEAPAWSRHRAVGSRYQRSPMVPYRQNAATSLPPIDLNFRAHGARISTAPCAALTLHN